MDAGDALDRFHPATRAVVAVMPVTKDSVRLSKFAAIFRLHSFYAERKRSRTPWLNLLGMRIEFIQL